MSKPSKKHAAQKRKEVIQARAAAKAAAAAEEAADLEHAHNMAQMYMAQMLSAFAQPSGADKKTVQFTLGGTQVELKLV